MFPPRDRQDCSSGNRSVAESFTHIDLFSYRLSQITFHLSSLNSKLHIAFPRCVIDFFRPVSTEVLTQSIIYCYSKLSAILTAPTTDEGISVNAELFLETE